MSSCVALLNAKAINEAIAKMAGEIARQKENGSEFVLVGIQRGGVVLAERLAERLGQAWGRNVMVGRLDINMHRDDLDQRAAPPVYPTVIPFDVTGKTVVLVDDVLFSGRTIRAAMDALNDFGRPKRIQLAVLIDRGHLELPIRADYVGRAVETRPTDQVNVKLGEGDEEEAVYLESA